MEPPKIQAWRGKMHDRERTPQQEPKVHFRCTLTAHFEHYSAPHFGDKKALNHS